MKLMTKYVSMFMPGYAKAVIYMLQTTEYQSGPYFVWRKRVQNYSKVMNRGGLKKTKAARLLLLALYAGMLAQVLLGLAMVSFGFGSDVTVFTLLGLFVVVTYPVAWGYLVVVSLELGRFLISRPKQNRLIARSEKIFANHPGVKIAVAGSYGKTTMKELLQTVLSQGKNVIATPGNKNVSVSHAYFGMRLTGKEDIVIIEYGEGEPGDIARFASMTHPDMGIITGLAPAHLDKYASLDDAAQDIFALGNFIEPHKLYVNGESELSRPYVKPGFELYSSQSVLGWSVSDISVSVDGTKFVMQKSGQELKLHSGLLGRHLVGPLAFVAALAIQLGLTADQVVQGIAQTHSFEHRMQPRNLKGAWVIDDTYNGNIEGMKAGLRLLADLPGKRKIYVTPGLVDQGAETQNVHIDLGKSIAQANPDKLVLMNNSVTEFIRKGLEEAGYKGEVQIEDDPLDFYTNLEHFIASGDLVVMQNDWPDNYN